MATQLQQALTVLRRKQVEARTGLSRSSLYAAIQAKTFPPAFSLTSRSVGWLASDIDSWVLARASGKSEADITALVATLVAQREQLT